MWKVVQYVALFALLLGLGVPQAAAQRGNNKPKGGFGEDGVGCFTLRSDPSDVFFAGAGSPFCHDEDGQVSVPKRFRYDSDKFNPEDGETHVNLTRSTGCSSSTDLACLNADRIVEVIQSELQYSGSSATGFVYAGGMELDFPGMSQSNIAGVSVKFDFRVANGGQGVRRLSYGTSLDNRVDCPVASGAQPVEVECNCSDGSQCREWTLRADKACLFNPKTGQFLEDTVDAPWELSLVASGPACVP